MPDSQISKLAIPTTSCTYLIIHEVFKIFLPLLGMTSICFPFHLFNWLFTLWNSLQAYYFLPKSTIFLSPKGRQGANVFVMPYIKSENAIHHAELPLSLYGHKFSLNLQVRGYVLFCIYLCIPPILSGYPINNYWIEWVTFLHVHENNIYIDHSLGEARS